MDILIALRQQKAYYYNPLYFYRAARNAGGLAHGVHHGLA